MWQTAATEEASDWPQVHQLFFSCEKQTADTERAPPAGQRWSSFFQLLPVCTAEVKDASSSELTLTRRLSLDFSRLRLKAGRTTGPSQGLEWYCSSLSKHLQDETGEDLCWAVLRYNVSIFHQRCNTRMAVEPTIDSIFFIFSSYFGLLLKLICLNLHTCVILLYSDKVFTGQLAPFAASFSMEHS